MLKTLNLGELSFYWRMADKHGAPGSVPTFLPFAFGFDARTQLITQEPNARVLEALRQSYLEDHNIGYLQEGHALADKYGQDFLGFIQRMLTGCGRPVTSVLDVGCGGCYVLKALQGQGFAVFGVDPSPVAARWGREIGIPIATGFYPMAHGFGKMDVVLSSGVLEHVPDPVTFLRGHLMDLAPGGHIIVSTPDSAPSIELGDPSMVLHEHISYFDQDSLRRVVTEAGYEVLVVEYANYGQSLYCFARPLENQGGPSRVPAVASVGEKFERFSKRVGRSLMVFAEQMKPLLSDRSVSLGFYVPLRALPYLSILKVFDGVRFFDDDPGIRAKYFDGFDVPVENFQDLQARPVTHMIIMSLPHAPAIAKKLRAYFEARMAVRTLAEIIAEPEQ
jgi:2-polyprenyl-3-methyl-5-hydroxy-6-metoxy-1,4-benzoquinol methylase